MDHTECHLRLGLSPTRRKNFNHNVVNMLQFVQEHENPYQLTVSISVSLHNILTKQAVERDVALRLLKCFENGEIVYRSYRKNVFVYQTIKISSTMSTRKLPWLTHQSQEQPLTILKEKKDISSKSLTEVQ